MCVRAAAAKLIVTIAQAGDSYELSVRSTVGADLSLHLSLMRTLWLLWDHHVHLGVWGDPHVSGTASSMPKRRM